MPSAHPKSSAGPAPAHRDAATRRLRLIYPYPLIVMAYGVQVEPGAVIDDPDDVLSGPHWVPADQPQPAPAAAVAVDAEES